MTNAKYNALTIVEKIQFVGKSLHMIQTDIVAFDTMQELIEQGDRLGFFDGVKILPEREIEN